MLVEVLKLNYVTYDIFYLAVCSLNLRFMIRGLVALVRYRNSKTMTKKGKL